MHGGNEQYKSPLERALKKDFLKTLKTTASSTRVYLFPQKLMTW